YGHSLTARRFNIETRDIILLPIGGLARLEKMPEDPGQELKIAIAGPLVNIAIAIILYGVISVTGITPSVEEAAEGFAAIRPDNFLHVLILVNLVLAVFNMIPAFPMDGGRVLRALMAYKYPRPQATRMAATVGQIISAGFVIIGIFIGHIFLILIGVFIFMAAQAEADYTQAKSFLQGYTVKDVVMHEFNMIDYAEPLSKAIDLLLNGQGTDFLITKDGEVAGTLSRNEMIKALTEKGKDTQIGAVMNPDVQFLESKTPLEELYNQAGKKNASLMPVVENDELIGVLDTENILEFIMIREAEERNKFINKG
ncbi:MAG: site-2 protease family protein, partial [Bacteroidetes bacterium]|nr:site-2 protease family protein [Bacteroidota bacterium]